MCFFFLAAHERRPPHLADLLLARGDLASLRAFLSDARHDTELQDTLLTWAARHGQAEAVRLLLEGGASVGATNGGGASALYIACQEGQIGCVRLLVECQRRRARTENERRREGRQHWLAARAQDRLPNAADGVE